MVRAWNRTPLESGKNLSVAALMSVLIVVMSTTLERDAWCESWEHLSVATLLALGIVESMSAWHSSMTRNVSRDHTRRTTLLKTWIIANPTTLRWERSWSKPRPSFRYICKLRIKTYDLVCGNKFLTFFSTSLCALKHKKIKVIYEQSDLSKE